MSRVDQLILNIRMVIINPLIGFLFAAGLVVFLAGVVQFLARPDNEEWRKRGKLHMITGVVGMALMVSAWAIIAILQNTLGV